MCTLQRKKIINRVSWVMDLVVGILRKNLKRRIRNKQGKEWKTHFWLIMKVVFLKKTYLLRQPLQLFCHHMCCRMFQRDMCHDKLLKEQNKIFAISLGLRCYISNYKMHVMSPVSKPRVREASICLWRPWQNNCK